MDVNKQTLKLFAQDDYYINNWHSLESSDSRFSGFNIYAMLFGMTWCFYRKLYGLGIACLIAAFVVSIIAVTLYVWLVCCDLDYSVMETRTGIISFFSVLILVRIPLGLYANKIYYKKAVTIINKHISTPSISDDDRLYLIEIEGGSSIGGLMISLLISLVINILTFYP